MIDTSPPAEPPLPPLEAQIRARSKVNAYGSSAVQDAVDDWHAAVNKITSVDILISLRMRSVPEQQENASAGGAGPVVPGRGHTDGAARTSPPNADPDDTLDQIERLAALHDSGVLSDSEFAELRREPYPGTDPLG